MKKLRISSSLNLHYHSKENTSEYIRSGLLFHKEMGFDAANFDSNLINYLSDDWQADVERAIADSEEIGVKFEISHLPFGGGEGFEEKMRRAIDASATVGVDYAVLHPNWNTTLPVHSFNRREQYDKVMQLLAPQVEYAAKAGVNVVVENMRLVPGFMLSHRYCQDPDELCEIADALGIGVCWDFGHAHISGVKQSEGLSYVGKRLKVLHVNDNYAIEDEHVAPFMGTVDWRDAMHGLALAGFDGLFNYELATDRLPASVRKSYAKYMIDAANELMSYID